MTDRVPLKSKLRVLFFERKKGNKEEVVLKNKVSLITNQRKRDQNC